MILQDVIYSGSLKMFGLKAVHNPPDPAPPYPGAWRRQNKKGSLMSKNDYLQQHTNQWLEYVKKNPAYYQSILSVKAKVLRCHLQGQATGNKLTHRQCRELIIRAELEQGPVDHVNADEQNNEEYFQEQDVKKKKNNGEDKDKEDSSEEDDNDWQKDEDRIRKAKLLQQFLSKSDEEIFESNVLADEALGFKISNTKKFKIRREVYSKQICDNKTEDELFKSERGIVNEYVLKSKVYKQKKEQFCSIYFHQYFEGKSSQDILMSISQTPKVVIESKIFKDRVKHLSRKEKAEIVALQSARDTIKALDENPSKEGREQKKLLVSSLTSLVFGPPEFGLSGREVEEVTEMKRKLMTGEEKVLKVPSKPHKEMYPPEVTQVAKEHWEEITQVDPSKIKRKALKDGEETVATRYQLTTNEEAFHCFKDQCSEKVEQIMTKEAKHQEDTLVKRKDSADKENRLKYVRTLLPKKFPGQSWFIEQRPPEVKLMNDHTTGVCKVFALLLL